MQTTSISSLNHTFEETGQWLRELSSKEPFQNEEQAYSLLRAVLHAIRDRLTVEEAAHLGSQLPMLVRGFYFEGWQPAKAPNDWRTVDEFLDHVRSSLGGGPRIETVDLGSASKAVMGLLEAHVAEGQLRHVRDQLPAEIESFLGARAAA